MALNIPVNSTYKLTSDEFNVIVNQKFVIDPKKSPKWAEGMDDTIREEWRKVAYCRTVEKALNWIADQTQRESNAESIGELLGEIKAFRRDISAVLAK